MIRAQARHPIDDTVYMDSKVQYCAETQSTNTHSYCTFYTIYEYEQRGNRGLRMGGFLSGRNAGSLPRMHLWLVVYVVVVTGVVAV